MRLALRLGRTLSELRHSLSASEAMMWMEFDRISPLGDERGDIRNAQIVKAVFGAQGMNVALKDVMNRPGFPGECFICELRLP
ncbi:phage tail assembly protein T, partial [Shigella boydii]|uniref:phage tail assembly protein T n=1 Tax=Shigella boydii TaxID=621 RepID=UPI000E5CFA82